MRKVSMKDSKYDVIHIHKNFLKDEWKSAQKYDWNVFQTEECKILIFDLKIMNFQENRYKYFMDYQILQAKWESKKFS